GRAVRAAERPGGGGAGRGRQDEGGDRDEGGDGLGGHGSVLGVGFHVRPASSGAVSARSLGGNDRVTGRVRAETMPPPGAGLARSVPPRSAACSEAIASPRPELPPARDGSAL